MLVASFPTTVSRFTISGISETKSQFLSSEVPKCRVLTCFTNSWPHTNLFTPSELHTLRFHESRYNAFGSPTHETLKCRFAEMVDDVLPRTYIASRDFGDLRTKVSTSYLPKTEMLNSNSLLMLAPQRNFSLCRDFTLRDFTNLDARFSVLQLANPRSENSRVIQWPLSTWILRSDFS
jgi:hypothetical protein